VVTAEEQRRRPTSVLDDDEREEQVGPAGGVGGLRGLDVADLFAVLVEGDVGEQTGRAGHGGQ